MIVLIGVIFFTLATCHRVTESVEDVPPEAFFNTTTLYPVANTTTTEGKANKTEDTVAKNKINSEESTWKIETALVGDNNDREEEKTTESPEAKRVADTENKTQKFRPSPHLGPFFDATPTRPTFDDFTPLKKPTNDFMSLPKDQFKAGLFNKDIRHQNNFPYKFEDHLQTRAKDPWRPAGLDLDSRPTMQVPVKIPAGGFYKSPEAFKEKPSFTDNEYGLDFNDFKQNSLNLKKRVNPWKGLIQMMTAFIPVGLIISALTPNVITVHSSGSDNKYPTPLLRKSDKDIQELSAISEPCRRKLLCELHSDSNYKTTTKRPRRRQCHRLPCEDPETLTRTLEWLLSRQRADNHRST